MKIVFSKDIGETVLVLTEPKEGCGEATGVGGNLQISTVCYLLTSIELISINLNHHQEGLGPDRAILTSTNYTILGSIIHKDGS